MRITHFGHSCVLLEKDTTRVLFDPGAFSTAFEDLRDLDAIVITHQHADHVDVDRLPALIENNRQAQLITDTGSAEILVGRGFTPTAADAGDSFDVGEFAFNVVGGKHAVIHPDLPQVDNIGYVVDHGAFYHPGDAFHVPEQAIDVLGLPTGAPWLKLSEAIDFLRAVAPRVAVPIHEAVLAMPAMHYRRFEELGPEDTAVRVLDRGDPATV
ncbi:MBL fold metallo-hydrolase [Parasphingorhabdus pacifica]